MKILQVIDTLNVGGAERVFVDMCNILYENNHNVTALLLLENNGELASELKTPIKQLRRENKWSLKSMYRCSKILKKQDIVHCHFRHVYAYVSLVNFIFFCDSKIILHDHFGSIDIDKKIPFLFDSFFKPNYYIGVSKTLIKWSQKRLKISKQNTYILPNIVRKKNYLTKSKKKLDLILISNIKTIKNNLFAVELAKHLNRKLVLIGKVQDKEYFIKIEKQLNSDICINSTITDAQAISISAKIGLHTSKSESGPLVLIEYLAQGLPFLAYETGEVAKILKPHFPDYFIHNFDLQEWKVRLEKINNSEPDLQKMYHIFELYFGEKQYFEKLQNIYQCINDY